MQQPSYPDRPSQLRPSTSGWTREHATASTQLSGTDFSLKGGIGLKHQCILYLPTQLSKFHARLTPKPRNTFSHKSPNSEIAEQEDSPCTAPGSVLMGAHLAHSLFHMLSVPGAS